MQNDIDRQVWAKMMGIINAWCLIPLVMSFQTNIRLLFSLSMIAYGLTFLAEYVLSRRYTQFTFSKRHYWYIAMIALWLLFPIYHIFENTSEFYHHEMEKHLAFLLFGVMGFMGAHKRVSLRTAAISCIAMAVIANILVLIAAPWTEIIDSEQPLMVLHETRVRLFSEHMRYNLCENMALLACFYIYDMETRKSRKWIICAAIALIVICMFTSPGRAGVVTMLILLSIRLIAVLWHKSKISAVALPILVITCGAALMISTQKWQEFNRLTQRAIHEEPRIMVWKAASSVIRQHPLGLGASDGLTAYHEAAYQYEPLHYDNIYLSHTHNVWLQYSLYFGIPGFILISMIFFIPPAIVEKKRKRLIIITLIPLFIEALVDVFGNAMPPAMFLLTLWLIVETKTEDKITKQINK
ncbi:MAG TPA: hypothetical protein DEO38_04425 [Bacteroidales bacterium]|nr:hypothetical protein [Bacteroidales bacterium]